MKRARNGLSWTAIVKPRVALSAVKPSTFTYCAIWNSKSAHGFVTIRRLAIIIHVFFACGAVVSAAEVYQLSVSVRDFGAKGDGRTDDTLAIQKAADFVHESARTYLNRRYYNGMIDGACRELLFDEGTYLLSKQVVFDWNVSLRGIGKAVIKQSDLGKEAFYFTNAFHCCVADLGFEGGSHQLRFWTRNYDTACLRVENCVFHGSGSYAIESHGSQFPDAKGVYADESTYEIIRRGSDVTLKARDPEVRRESPNSTSIVVDKCDFIDCAGAVDIASDGVTVCNCRLVTPLTMNGGAFKTNGNWHVHGLDARVSAIRNGGSRSSISAAEYYLSPIQR